MNTPEIWSRLGLVVCGLLCFAGTAGAQGNRTVGVMPSVTPEQYVERGLTMVEHWVPEGRAASADTRAMYESVRGLLDSYSRFRDEVADIYPVDQLEWLLITDEVADSLTRALMGPLDSYKATHPEEILTQGRQLLEMELMRIAGPPPRTLGFHVVRLANWAYDTADTLLTGKTEDFEGLADGVLRNLQDWIWLWEQVHDSQLDIYQSRLVQQDWIMTRLRDRCGDPGKWKITQQFMAMVGVDSSRTPPRDLFAHEFHIESTSCDDKRVVRIELPNFLDMQEEVLGATQSVSPGR